MKENEIGVTDLTKLRELANPVVEIPGWEEGTHIMVRLRRVSLMSLLEGNKIPNDLLTIALKYAKGDISNPYVDLEADDFINFTRLQKHVARTCLVEPTMEALEEAANAELTDNQLLAIWLYSRGGVKALEPFRSQP